MAAQLILVEASPRQASDGAARTVRLAGGGAAYPYYYAGGHWMAGITGAPTIITSLTFDGTDLGSGGVPQAAEIVWGTTNRADLADLAGLVWADAPITVRIGPEGSLPPIALSGKVLTATVEDGGKLKIAMADPAADLKKPLLTARWGGTGGLDGPADWAGTIKRRIWGRVFNVQGEPLDAVHNIYSFADPLRHLQAITAVRDKGAAGPLTVLAWAGTAEATFAALQAAAVPAGGGIVCPSLACVRWWTQPAGDLTADIEGETEGGYVETAAGIASRLVAAVDGPAFAAGTIASADADRPAPVGWIAADESTTVAAMLDQLLGSVSILWALNAAGQIELRRWAWGASALSVKSHAVTRSASYRPVSSRRLGYRRNEHKMARGSLAAIVLVSDVAFDDGSGLAETLGDIATAASDAASAAATAQAAANLANAGLADIAADNVLTPGEKPQVVLNYNVLVTEQSGIDGQAAAYGITTERMAYDNALTALLSYLSGLTTPYLWSNLTGNTDIVGPTFRGKFADVYSARQILLNAISAKAKVLADNAQADASAAASAAASAGAQAAAALASANAANAAIAEIASDNILAAGEKPQIIVDRYVLEAERSGINAQATIYGIGSEKTAYNNALDALSIYLSSLTSPVPWDYLSGPTTIDGPTFRGKFADCYTTRQALLNAISAKAKALADGAATTATWGGISGGGGRPSGSDVAGTVKSGGGVADGQVNTGAVISNAISAPLQASTSWTIAWSGDLAWHNAASVTVSPAGSSSVFVIIAVVRGTAEQSGFPAVLNLRIDNAGVGVPLIPFDASYGTTITMSALVGGLTGATTFTIQGQATGAGYNNRIFQSQLVIVELKK
ncbi:hypothetical protein [Novosphingobium sp. KACC 22771]|uniref:hypothetical protein n=1 Tax=Novosphingobium sp. KACC 22771 TaxID=3025670 RepID=UPI002365ED34|nr:hypothetical protein [Novosphingobium sp. KACC 22771]WDF73478.1 hypothetical protein PQ467_05385 [Novosphingobium sp. KACC 22771]